MTLPTASEDAAIPAFLSMGFRPFFLMSALWALVAMGLWLLTLTGAVSMPSLFDPVSWHSHELLFGYLSAVLAGFLLTAVPNWTGRAPLQGGNLAALALLWIVGRVAVMLSAMLPAGVVIAVDLAFLTVLTGFITREIVAGGNWRNLTIVGLLAAMILGNGLFHWEAVQGDYAAQGTGARLGLAAAIMMIAVIGGRVVPAFTRNWLTKQGSAKLPVPPMQSFDKFSLFALLLALGVWLVAPEGAATGVLFLAVGVLHLARLARWSGHMTGAEPLVAVLHVAYLFLPVGALALGAATLWPGLMRAADAQHFWMAGTIGLMTLAIMTRATLGHSGQPLNASIGTLGVFGAVMVAVLARIAAGLAPDAALSLYALSGLAWIAAFGGFALLYGRLLLGLPAKSG